MAALESIQRVSADIEAGLDQECSGVPHQTEAGSRPVPENSKKIEQLG